MDLKEILNSKDEFTKEELECLCSCLSILSTSLTDTIHELRIQLISEKASYLDITFNKEISYYIKCKFLVVRLHSILCEFLRNGGNNNEM